MEKFVITNNTALRYRDCGKGEKTVVLIHGYLESIEIWDELMDMLSKKYRVLAFDVPGHGVSEVKSEIHTMEFIADTMNDLLIKVGIEKVVVCGHSMGGYIALEFAAKYAQKVSGIVLFHSTPNSDSEKQKELREREIEIITSGRKEVLININPGKSFAPENIKRFAKQIQESQLQIMMTEDEGIIALLKGMAQRKDNNDMLRSLEAKQLFFFGKCDSFIPVQYAESVEKDHPQAEVVWLEHSGHNGFVEERNICHEKLCTFLEAI